jgi:DNA-binding SARP family transcriptional activator
MFPQENTRVSLASFRERSEGKKVILFYPWTNYRNLFLSHFLNNMKEGLLYYRVTNEQMSISDWMEGMVAEFNEVIGSFGENLKQALKEPKPAKLGEALAADLKKIAKHERTILFFDELDHVPMDSDFEAFMRALVNNLPHNVQITISARLLTHQPWQDMINNGTAVVLGTEQRRNDLMFVVETNPKPQLEVYALGRGYALVNGTIIANWDGALPRNLFFYFMDHPLVTRDEIFSTFWPDLSVKEATNVFHVTKRKITERISMKVNMPGSYELTQYNSGFYMPSDKLIRHYDVADFQEAVERSMVAKSQREEAALLLRAIDLYKAPFLQQIEMKWVQERREQLRQLYAQALIAMGRIREREGNHQEALSYYTRALKETPEREDIHRSVMQLYTRMGMYDDARRQFHHLEKVLHERFGIDPSRETRELYESIERR